MGADGHIRIMDADKLCQNRQLSEERFKEFLDILRDSMTYCQNFEGRKLITNYWGDNIYCVSNLENLVSYKWEKGNWQDPFYYDGLYKEVADSTFTHKDFLELAEYLWDNCEIAQWEVWT